MDKKEFKKYLKELRQLYWRGVSDVDPKQFETLINKIADAYLDNIESVADFDTNGALMHIFADAVKDFPQLALKQDLNGNTFVHKIAKTHMFSDACFYAIELVPESMDIKNNDGQTFVDLIGITQLKFNCVSVLKLAFELNDGYEGRHKGIYKTLCEKYPTPVKETYVDEMEEYIAKFDKEYKDELEEKPLLSNIEFWFKD